MRRYIVRRLASLIVVLWGVSVLSFALGSLAPGDPARILMERTLGHPATDEEVVQKRHELGLDRPVVVQYVSWAGGALRGDLGYSWSDRGQPVSHVLLERLPRTVALAVSALIISVLVAVPLGVIAARRQNSLVDHSSRVAALVGASIPSFFLGYLLMFVFGVWLQLLPIFGFASPQSIVLPAVTLALGASAILTRLTRSSLLEVLGEDYIRVGEAMGLRSRTVLFRHALRNALIPILTVIGLSFGHLLAGAVIVESIFNWPGLGKLALDAIHARDYPLIQGFVLLTGTVFVLMNLVTDLAYRWADPRVRLQGKGEIHG
ncbi:MAG: nickel ABC transporter permease [Pseudonocardiaceae bacterium]